MTFLSEAAIDAAILLSSVAGADCGAVVTFAGVVRDHHAGRQVVSLGYSAYPAMVERLADEITARAVARWDVRIAMQHRVGELQVGDVAVAIAVAAAHRAAAFDACRWLIDEIKAQLPIWKRECYADGSEAWVDPTAPDGVVVAAP